VRLPLCNPAKVSPARPKCRVESKRCPVCKANIVSNLRTAKDSKGQQRIAKDSKGCKGCKGRKVPIEKHCNFSPLAKGEDRIAKDSKDRNDRK
jgi:hypothetical protein